MQLQYGTAFSISQRDTYH